MAILVNSVTIINDVVSEPVSLTDAKNWMRITNYTSDDSMIRELLQSARIHIEKLCGRSLASKTLKANISLTGSIPSVWMVDLPYSPLVCVTEVKRKTGMNTYDILTENEDFEVIGGKIWFYIAGIYSIKYEAGYSPLPEDLKNDILTLTAWMYENRGKAMNADNAPAPSQYPNWDGMNYYQYKQVLI